MNLATKPFTFTSSNIVLRPRTRPWSLCLATRSLPRPLPAPKPSTFSASTAQAINVHVLGHCPLSPTKPATFSASTATSCPQLRRGFELTKEDNKEKPVGRTETKPHACFYPLTIAGWIEARASVGVILDFQDQMRRSGREMESGWDPSKIDAKVASVLVPEERARYADGMPLIDLVFGGPTREGGWVVLLIWCPGALTLQAVK
ncbi:hypothetical protein THAOC_18388, partial [Thalassiosira oceanica]